MVGIASSAGGLPALIEVVKAAYCHENMCFILVPHLSREYETQLPSLLRHYTTLKSRLIEQSMPLEHCTFNVLPPNAYVEVRENSLKLLPRPAGGTNQSANVLFKSLAEFFGENSIGVVLSGAGVGADGSEGVVEIKNAGGHTYAQDPATAEFPDMPELAISTGCVDLVLPPAEIGRHLSLVSWA